MENLRKISNKEVLNRLARSEMTTMNKEYKEHEDRFVRDVTAVTPLPKSEVRERLAKLVELKYEEELKIADGRWKRAESEMERLRHL